MPAVPSLSVEWAMGDSWHAWRSPLGCTFVNTLSQHLLPKGVALWCLTAPGYLLPLFSSCAITPKSIGKCSWTTTSQATTTKRKLFFLNPALFPTPVHSLALGVILMCFFWQWHWLRRTRCSWPSGLGQGVTWGRMGGHAGPRASLPPWVGGGRGQQQAQLN